MADTKYFEFKDDFLVQIKVIYKRLFYEYTVDQAWRLAHTLGSGQTSTFGAAAGASFHDSAASGSRAYLTIGKTRSQRLAHGFLLRRK